MSQALIVGYNRTKGDPYPEGIYRVPGRQRHSAASTAWNCLDAKGDKRQPGPSWGQKAGRGHVIKCLGV